MSSAFPVHPVESELKDILADQRFTVDEARWLKSNKQRFVDGLISNEMQTVLRKYLNDLGVLDSRFKEVLSKQEDKDNVNFSLYKIEVNKLEEKVIDSMYEICRKAL